MQCPCGSNQTYSDCCGQYIANQQSAPTPEALMRSRYTAFVLNEDAYILATMRGKALKKQAYLPGVADNQSIQWQGLTIISYKLKTHRLGFVTFKASYLFAHELTVLYEKSEFHKIGDRWFYVNGRILATTC